MNHFIDPYARLLYFLLEKLHKSPSLTLSYHIDRVAFFKQKVAQLLRSGVGIDERVYDAPYPTLATTQVNVKLGDFQQSSFGIATDQEYATFIAEAEFLERLSSWLPLDLAISSAYDKKLVRAQSPKELSLKSALASRKKSSLISEVYWGLQQSRDIPYHVTTSGTATHTTHDAAVLSAWLELIERDAFFVHWLNGISPRHIDTTKLEEEDGSFRSIVEQLRSSGCTFYILDITTDIAVPTCLALLIIQTDKGCSFGVSAKASFDTKKAIINSLMDAVAVAHSVEDMAAQTLPEAYLPFSDASLTKEKRLALYKTRDAIDKASFLWRSSQYISYEDFGAVTGTYDTVKKQLGYLRNLFHKRYENDDHYDVFVYRFSNKLLSQFGFHAVRVLCAALYPIYLTESFGDPRHPRLKEFARYKGAGDDVAIITFPHPFS